MLMPLFKAVDKAVKSSSSSSSQVTASARLLLVLVARSLLVLHDALTDAAGIPHVRMRVLLARNVVWTENSSVTWQRCQNSMVRIGGDLLTALQPAMQQQPQQPDGACCWPHLLQLHEAPELVAAVQRAQQTYVEAYCGCLSDRWAAADDPPFAQQDEQQQQQQQGERAAAVVAGVMSFCKVLVAAVPLPEVCNNPGCSSLRGVSEAAAAVKAWAGCGTRYCCRECQQSWRTGGSTRRLAGGCGAAAVLQGLLPAMSQRQQQHSLHNSWVCVSGDCLLQHRGACAHMCFVLTCRIKGLAILY
jgi:hypothetical protein